MDNKLTQQELVNLIKSVFSPTKTDKHLVFIVDLPDDTVGDTPAWEARREMVIGWVKTLQEAKSECGLDRVDLAAYNNVHSNNADLPEELFLIGDITTSDELAGAGTSVSTTELFDLCQLVIAPTQLSATAPLKLLSRRHNFRGATMPGTGVVYCHRRCHAPP